MKSFVLLMLRFSSLACVFCGFFLLLALLIGRALPTDRLMFLSNRDGVSKLYAIDIHRGLTYKVNDTPVFFSYALSPDGTQVLYEEPTEYRGNVVIMNLIEGDTRQLVEQPAFYPSWSPDSQYITFFMYDENTYSSQIHRLNRDGTDLKVLTNLVDIDPTAPLWSPDGTQILFSSSANGNKHNTYIMNADGSNLQQVSNSDGFEAMAAADWSPDSHYLAFVGQSTVIQDGNIKSTLCLIELDSDDLHCLADDVFSSLAWSPDSKFIAYVSTKGYGIFNLEIVNIETGEIRRIVHFDEVVMVQITGLGHPMWTPDAKAIIYEVASGRDYDLQLNIINTDGSGERRLTDGISANYAAAWWSND